MNCAPTGWRANKALAVGGVLLDMGYHVLDVIVRFFGSPCSRHSNLFVPAAAQEGLESRAEVTLWHDGDVYGSIVIDNLDSEGKNEFFEIIGDNGKIAITPSHFDIFDKSGTLVEHVNGVPAETTKAVMFEAFINNRGNQQFLEEHFIHHCNIVRTMTEIYKASSWTTE
jgi:predicted dehydrogenase